MHARIVTVLLALVLAAGPAPLPASPAPQQPEKKVYDGAFWASIGNWEQAGFMNGYVDCHTFEYRGSVPLAKAPQAYVEALNEFYQQSGDNKTVSITDALDRSRSAANETSAPPVAAGAENAVPHGAYDGKFWFDAENPQVQQGFVEGYLACHAAKVKDADGHFSKAPEEYVPLINDAYGITDDTDEVDAQKGAQKIADVLHRLRDVAGANK